MRQVKVNGTEYNVYGRAKTSGHGYVQVNIGKSGPERCIQVQRSWWDDSNDRRTCYTSGELIEKGQ